MSRTTLQTIGLFVGLGLIVVFAPLLWQMGEVDQSRAGLPVGQPMPQLTGVDGWLNGDGPTKEELQGKVVFVNAWFLNCPYCHKGMPDLVDLYNEYHDQGVIFVGMTFDEGDAVRNVERFLEKYNVEWPNAYGAREALGAFQIEYFPGYWLIGRDGKVVWNKALQGRVPLKAAIDDALAASPPATTEPDTTEAEATRNDSSADAPSDDAQDSTQL